MSDAYAPRPEHQFTFGLWTVGNDAGALGAVGAQHERLDQLVTELLLGVR